MQFSCLLLLLLLQPLLPDRKVGACPGSTMNGIAHLDTAISYIGTVELTNHNDGPIVEKFLKSVGRKKGDSWCAAFVSYCLKTAEVNYPRICSGLARSFKLKNSIRVREVLIGKQKIFPGIIIVWEKGNTVFGHVGFVEKWFKQNGVTIEGNTCSDRIHSVVMTNELIHEGVFRKNRTIEPGNYFRITCFTQVQSGK